jgi:hypothetical protein
MGERYGTRMARQVRAELLWIMSAVGLIASDVQRELRAGEGNRTPTVSLGS